MSGCRSCSGRLFNRVGPAVAKQRSPNWLRDLLTKHVRLSADCRGRWPVAVTSVNCKCSKYIGSRSNLWSRMKTEKTSKRFMPESWASEKDRCIKQMKIFCPQTSLRSWQKGLLQIATQYVCRSVHVCRNGTPHTTNSCLKTFSNPVACCTGANYHLHLNIQNQQPMLTDHIVLSQITNDLSHTTRDDVWRVSEEYSTVCLWSLNGAQIDLTVTVISWYWLQLAVNL